MHRMAAGSESNGNIARDISRETVRLYKKYVGRGPTTARTYLAEDLVVTVLHETLTQAEKTLADADHGEQVREQRRVFQESFRKEAVANVERLTGREVKAFLSDHAIDPDYVIEAFVLVPKDE